jgi:hypothetical protein
MDTYWPSTAPLPWRDVGTTAKMLRLRAGQLHAIAAPGGLIVRCAAGDVWVTQEGNPGDIVLSGGEQFQPHPRGKVVLQAVTDATVMLG